MRNMNDEMTGLINTQMTKKSAIQEFEKHLLHEDDYNNFLEVAKEDDKKLYEASVLFADLTKETKRILDTVKGKSDERKKSYGVDGDDIKAHHKPLPKEIKSKLEDTGRDVS
jgi:hypothetical protein